MTDVNHRRKNKAPVNQRFKRGDYRNGYADPKNKNHQEEMKILREKMNANGDADVILAGEKATGAKRVGRTDYLDKSMHGWGRKSNLADQTFSAHIGNDFSKGHRGMAKAVKGAKKFVRSRVRFHENSATKKLNPEDS